MPDSIAGLPAIKVTFPQIEVFPQWGKTDSAALGQSLEALPCRDKLTSSAISRLLMVGAAPVVGLMRREHGAGDAAA